MSPERAARVVAAWSRLYTRGLPAPARERRREELAADLHDQIAAGRAAGDGDGRIARAVLWRAARGVGADVGWRGFELGATGILPLVVLALLAVPAAAMLVTDQVAWGVFDFVAAGALLLGTGLLGRATVRRMRGSRARAVGPLAGLALCAVLVFAALAVGLVGEPGDPRDALVVLAALGATAVFHRRARGRVGDPS